MDNFSKWTGLAHSILSKSHRKFKRCQARECLATWLGHRTYSSLRVHDRDFLLGSGKYAIVDSKAAVDRANSLGFQVTDEEWREVEMALKPSGISGGLWLIEMQSMQTAARLTFEDQSHRDIDVLWKAIGTPDGRHARSTVSHATIGDHPLQLRITVWGEVRAFNEYDNLAVPVVAEVVFERLGVRLYAEGEILSVSQVGPPSPYEPEFEGEFYGMSDD